MNTKTEFETASNAPIPTYQLHTLRNPNAVQFSPELSNFLKCFSPTKTHIFIIPAQEKTAHSLLNKSMHYTRILEVNTNSPLKSTFRYKEE